MQTSRRFCLGLSIGSVLTAAVFGVTMFLSRLILPRLMNYFGESTVSISFSVLSMGALVMCFAPGFVPRAIGLAIVGFGGGPLYPLTVDGLYASADHKIDSITLGAYCALASATAVMIATCPSRPFRI